MSKQIEPDLIFNRKDNTLVCIGEWTILHANQLASLIKKFNFPKEKQIKISGESLTKLDSAGALILLQFINQLRRQHYHITLVDFNEHQEELFALLEKKAEQLSYSPPPLAKQNIVAQIGQETIAKLEQANSFITLLGDFCIKLANACYEWRRFQLPSIVTNIYNTGVTALPILGLLSFLIGVVLAYQMGLQLETYGANIFIAYLSGMAIFREFAPLITAIIVAGRTSSAFTAQIGSMKINEEIDALYTMGLSPTELLVVPKVLGLLLIFPLLIFWSDFFSTLGAMIMAKFMLHVGYSDFMARLQESVGLKQLMLGLYKAPTFAILIALVGCFQGFRVASNADSIGTQTTKSVVQALFLIIVADAIYSVVYSWMDL